MPLNPQFDHLFQLLPNQGLLLLPDAPKFTIVETNISGIDLIGKGLFEAYPLFLEDFESIDLINLKRSLNSVIANKVPDKIQNQKYDSHFLGSKLLRYTNIQNIPIKDACNNITHIFHSVEVVKEKNNLEISFETERQRFTDLYLQAPFCMGILRGPNHVFEFVNQLYLELIGGIDILGKTIKEVFPEFEAQGIFNFLNTVYETGETFSAKEMHIKFKKEPAGEIVEMFQDVIYQPHKNINGKIDGIFFFFIDVSEKVISRKIIEESDKKYRELIENLPLATYSCDAEGHIMIYNNAAVALWGREPEIGKDKWCGSLKIYEENGNPLPIDKSPMGKALKEGGMITNEEIIIERPDGRKVNILPYPVLTLDATGEITGTLNVLVDITNRKIAESKLIKSEKSLKESQEVGHLGNWELKFETGIAKMSDEACRIYGLPLSNNDLSYEDWLSYIHPEDLDKVMIIISESQKTFCDTILNHRIVLKDGTVKNIQGKSKYSFDELGKLDGIYGIMLDVTETTKSEEKVRFQSNLLNVITQAAISINENGIINFWNKAATELYGWTAEEALGKNVFSLLSTEQKGEDTLEIMKELSKCHTSKEFVVRHKGGHTFTVFSSISPIYGQHGKFEGAIEVSLDITMRKRAEKKLKILNKELSDYKYALDESSIVAITNQKGIIKHVNENFCKISQFSSEELIGQDHRLISSGYHSKEYIENLWETISRGGVWKGALKNKAKDGSFYWVDSIITPFLDEEGKPYQYVVTRFDITESKLAEENLIKQNQELDFQNCEKEKRANELIIANLELEFQNREKEFRAAELSLSNKELVKTNIELDRFVYSVSHDLRSPLTSILGLISFIEEDSREPDTLEQIRMIRKSINRLDGFIKNILNYSQNNRTGLDFQKIPIKKTINEIVNSVRNIKEAKGISFQIDIDEQMPFYSDWYRFNTVLENLVSNAIKYHTKEIPGRFLKVTGTVDKEELKLSISDNGIGIDPKFHDKIFDMFYRLPGNTDGSGFGLYIVKETLEKMHGKIEIQSEKGVGSTFYITLKNLKE